MFAGDVVNEALDVGDGDPVTLQSEVALKRMQPNQFSFVKHRPLSSISDIYCTKKA